MKEHKFEFSYKVYNRIEELPAEQKLLLEKAREATNLAYAPYSSFFVGAAARLANGEIVKGSNQENASFPVGLCAERVLLGSISSLFPQVPVHAMAVSYHNQNPDAESDRPISPCGLCRQTIQEYENRFHHPIQIILGGWEGVVYVIESASHLLPFAFTSNDLTTHHP
ncbi:cytidine deaminase [Chitinophagaceae bacterium LB-8]|jgi:cytidine deaminase|uniref:Cytidine deaminase n=1 Tax=Paraflavisolibacter caeni TaxID=2982496 RepID=A0A9X2XY23_9BACT|nr:cytidine deaminase [Paraflavisolibacter caeni]MCU7551516.1 cytidine deaminase [Paraflavisolibacter caeni]